MIYYIFKYKAEYKDYYLNHDFSLKKSSLSYNFGKTIIYNDYKKFIEKVMYALKAQ